MMKCWPQTGHKKRKGYPWRGGGLFPQLRMFQLLLYNNQHTVVCILIPEKQTFGYCDIQIVFFFLNTNRHSAAH